MKFAVALLSWLLCAQLLAGPPTTRHAELETQHYRISADTVDINDVGRMLEEFHKQMTATFGRSPEGTLRVKIAANKEMFIEALRADGLSPVDAGGYFSHDNKVAYLWVQPSEYYTRQLILHECTHQFHLLVTTARRPPSARWYIEGLAEHYGIHNWDGKMLALATVPVITLEDYPAKALDHFENKLARDLEGLISGKREADRPESWALIHFLAEVHAAEFRKLCGRLDAGDEPLTAWNDIFGPVTTTFRDDFEIWLRFHQQPWKIETVHWQQRGETLEGRSDTTASAILKETPSKLSVEIVKSDSGTWPGVLFGYHDQENFFAVQILPGHKARITHRSAGRWAPAIGLVVPRHEGNDTISVEAGHNRVIVNVNGTDVKTVVTDGSVGLYIQSGRAEFRVTQLKP